MDPTSVALHLMNRAPSLHFALDCEAVAPRTASNVSPSMRRKEPVWDATAQWLRESTVHKSWQDMRLARH